MMVERVEYAASATQWSRQRRRIHERAKVIADVGGQLEIGAPDASGAFLISLWLPPGVHPAQIFPPALFPDLLFYPVE